jgi:8-oxo-dGTP pyrophosphatase MutT (NUDIX family)
LDPTTPVVKPRDAATLLVVRPAAAGVEVFCVRRHAQSGFMGGALVFPGGKLDGADGADAWRDLADRSHPRARLFADDDRHALALAICACRESIEEASILPVEPAVDAARVTALRAQTAAKDGRPLVEVLAAAGLRLATGALVPFARWITPAAESRRYDARFFVTALPPGQEGTHDTHETTASLWATPARLLQGFAAGEHWLAPPTTRCLELLATVGDVAGALALCESQSLEPVCPQFVPGDPPFLALPGDPEHEIRERRVAGGTRFVLRDGRFISSEP